MAPDTTKSCASSSIPSKVSYDEILRVFWEGHDPTQGMRQGNDVGTQYRSAAYYYDEAQRAAIESSRAMYQERLRAAGHGDITTEVQPAPTFYFAESYHQQYLAKNPGGYCGHGGTGVSCPIGLATTRDSGENKAPQRLRASENNIGKPRIVSAVLL